MDDNEKQNKDQSQAPVPQETQSVFSGPISPTDQAVLLEFLRKNTTAVSYVNGRSHGTATLSIPGGFTPTRIDYNANDFANGVTWDGTNHRFKIVTAGQYLVAVMVGYNGVTAGKQYCVDIYKNGGQNAESRQHAGIGGAALMITCTNILDLAVNDYVEGFTQHNDAGANNLYNSDPFNFMVICRV